MLLHQSSWQHEVYMDFVGLKAEKKLLVYSNPAA